ncbi:DUF2092 domain-containing protein [Phenylobacterium sp.]|uniref:DUF2092 domain-containing protein n=1 Tax=Phenylobacterium sp. TaxID=1871053 RepID=UPI00289C702D|nr:DUF2092 domain-containing protein [Phenylobacterium sp.]
MLRSINGMAAAPPLAGAVLALCLGSGATAQARPDPAALQAAERMGTYLQSLKTFQVTSDVTLGAIEEGQRRELKASASYKVRRPDGFVIETTGERKARKFIYDGKSFTVFAPKVGYYASVSAPPTIRQTVDVIYDTYGVALPLADLFYWGEGASPTGAVTAASKVGQENVGGTPTDHYSYRSADLAWDLWIQRGAQPLPRKITITTLDDPARPTYSATLSWDLSPTFAPDTFAFNPAKDAKPIALAKVNP